MIRRLALLLLCGAGPQTVISLSGAPPLTGPLPYANAQAPQGGSLTIPGHGSFDSLNPFILRGTAPDTILQIWQPLFKLSDTDSVTAYADLAQTVTVEGHDAVFALDPAARFSDGTPVTAADAVWTLHTLITQGLPFFAADYAAITDARALDATHVRFTFAPTAGPDALFNLAGLYVLPAHFWAGRDFAAPLRDMPPGSGAYRIGTVSFGARITYTKVARWWGAAVPAEIGFNNFETVTQTYFAAPAAERQALRAGAIDARIEPSALLWARTGRHAPWRRFDAPLTLPVGMSGLAINTARPDLADRRVRHALVLAFDFAWENSHLLNGSGVRTASYFSNTGMSADLNLLPGTDGSGDDLANLRHAVALLAAAGWHVAANRLVNAAGQPMHLTILLTDAADTRFVLPYVANLAALGITADIITPDPTTAATMQQAGLYDLTNADYPITAWPGSEQAGYFGCAAAHEHGGANLSHICRPQLDAAIAAVIAAPDEAAKRRAVATMDARLQHGWYTVPWWYQPVQHIEYWPGSVSFPAAPLQVGHDFSLWWSATLHPR
jgi:microcin C transport system substrate-binding protein